MVLQREVPNAVWGTATAGATVTVIVDDGSANPPVSVSGTTAADGTYSIDIPPRDASTKPLTINVTSPSQVCCVIFKKQSCITNVASEIGVGVGG